MASHKTYLHFNKGLILENLKKEKKNTASDQVKEFSRTTTFSELCDAAEVVHLSRPQEGIFSSIAVREICLQRKGERCGEYGECQPEGGSGAGEPHMTQARIYLPYYVLLCTSQCYQPGMLFCVYIQMSSSHSDWDAKESFTRVISRPKIPQAPMWLNLSMILALNLIFQYFETLVSSLFI